LDDDFQADLMENAVTYNAQANEDEGDDSHPVLDVDMTPWLTGERQPKRSDGNIFTTQFNIRC